MIAGHRDDVEARPAERIGAIGTRQHGVARLGQADAVSFGRPFIGNPDLAERLRRNVPLAGYDKSLTYTRGPLGYTDYPTAT